MKKIKLTDLQAHAAKKDELNAIKAGSDSADCFGCACSASCPADGSDTGKSNLEVNKKLMHDGYWVSKGFDRLEEFMGQGGVIYFIT